MTTLGPEPIARRLRETLVDPVAHPLVRLARPDQVRMAFQHLQRLIRRSRIHDDVLELNPRLRKDAPDAVLQETPLVVAWGDDGKFQNFKW